MRHQRDGVPIIALCLACGPAEQAPASSAIPLDSPAAVVAAVRFATSLEDSLVAERPQFRSREEVYRHFRRGFGEDIAGRLTDHVWDAQSGRVAGTEMVLEVPDTVVVLRLEGGEAEVAYPTPPTTLEWGGKPYTIDRLRLEGARWLIVESRDTVGRPPGLPAPPA